jgi:protein-tyrosine phosphatase
MPPDLSVLFVCTGNICRSPSAEGVLRARLRAESLADRVATDSAGTHGYHVGDPPDARSVAAARRRGIDISDLRARKLAPADFARFDLILAMDRSHLAALQRLAPAGARAGLALFLDHAAGPAGRDVPDPYYGHGDHFEDVLDLLEDGVDGLMAELRRRLAETDKTD